MKIFGVVGAEHVLGVNEAVSEAVSDPIDRLDQNVVLAGCDLTRVRPERVGCP